MVNSMPASRLPGSEKTKEASLGRRILKTARSGESSTNSPSTRRTKSAMLDAYKAKMENITAKFGSGQSSMVFKKSGFEDSCSHAISSTPSPKPSSSVSFTGANNLTISCSSPGTPGGASSSKSSSNSLRRKTYSRKTKMDVSVSTSNTPSRYSARSKIRSENPSPLSTHYKSISSCTSLASSIDGCSSESSSSASTANQRSSNSKSILNTTSRGPLQLQNHPRDQSSLREGSQSIVCVQNASRGTDTVAAKSTRDFKPSGLRLPSPKIGFFDEEKHMVPTVRGSSQLDFEVRSALPCIDRDTKNKTDDMLQPARTLLETLHMKPGSQQTGVLHLSSGMKPRNAARFQELDNASKVSGTSRTKRNCLDTSLKAQIDTSPAVDSEKCLKTRKVTAGGLDARKFSPHSSLREERKGNGGILKNKTIIESKWHIRLRGNKISTNKGETGVHSEESSQNHPENDLHLLQKTETENLSDFEDQVDGLRKYLEVIDLSKDLVTEHKRKRGCSYSHCYDNSLENRSTLYLPTSVEFLPRTRTPLAEKNSVCNGGGVFGGLTESTTEKAAEKASALPSSDSTQKENS
ncbi:uncharacterized protein LOC132311955 [Cornus florida]|uniref:uncharacterized protein LOC132311955 n=1 Tax=Cornus florida TaxID=4283 RepID=UPI00289F4A77|nr:uncharacterized protein LOC132311955 [Cornus florida]